MFTLPIITFIRSFYLTSLKKGGTHSIKPLNHRLHDLKTELKSSGQSNFDYASKEGWEIFYSESHKFNAEEYEWHSSVSNDDIIKSVPNLAKSCLIVGCGSSRLPYELYHSAQHEQLEITCLDYSEICVAQLEERYTNLDSRIRILRGDATKLDDYFGMNEYDVIIDKGLVDVFMCGDGWDSDLEKLFNGACHVLCAEGRYILVSYKLANHTKRFLSDVSRSFQWQFDLSENSSSSVSFSVAVKN